MRVLIQGLILLLLLPHAYSEPFFHSDSSGTASQARQLRKRQDLQAAAHWSKVGVSEPLKNWKIFQDGNRVREGMRKGYVGLLRQLDKVREPYPEYKHIKKKWIYEPDLRKQYAVPRVLRVPAVLQETAIPHLQPFVAAVKNADAELGLNSEARSHVPLLSEHFDTGSARSAAQAAPESRSGMSPTDEISPQRSTRRRRKPTYSRNASFNRFRTASHHNPTPPRTPVPEIEEDIHSSREQADLSSGMPAINEARRGTGTPLISSDNGKQGRTQNPALDRWNSEIIRFQERFEQIKKFQAEQIKKASLRYSGHSENPTTGQSNARTLKEGAGLVPARIATATSPDLSADLTPRKGDDPTGMDADVSSPNTPTNHIPVTVLPGEPLHRWGSLPTPDISTPEGDPSPLLSPFKPLTPNTQSSTGASTPAPEKVGLPAHYADLLSAARQRQGIHHLASQPPVASTARGQKPVAGTSTRVSMGWDDGRPSSEGIKKVQELAQINDADYAIYSSDDVPRGQHSLMRSPKVHPFSQEEGRNTIASSGKAEEVTPRRDSALLTTTSSRPPVSRDRKLTESFEPGLEARRPPMPREFSFSKNFPTDQSFVKGPDSPTTHSDGESVSDAPVKKRKRPMRLAGASTRFFGFSPPQGELATPHLKGFKPSRQLGVTEEPNPNYDPADPGSSPGLVLRRQRMEELLSQSGSTSKPAGQASNNLATRNLASKGDSSSSGTPDERQSTSV